MGTLEGIGQPFELLRSHPRQRRREVSIIPLSQKRRLEQQDDLGCKERDTVAADRYCITQPSFHVCVASVTPDTTVDLAEQDLDAIPIGIVCEDLVDRELELLTSPTDDRPLADSAARMWDHLEQLPVGEVIEHRTLVIAGDEDVDILMLARHLTHEQVDRPPAGDVPRSGEIACRLEGRDEIVKHNVILFNPDESGPNTQRNPTPRTNSISDADYFANWA